jgi:Putative Ig domain
LKNILRHAAKLVLFNAIGVASMFATGGVSVYSPGSGSTVTSPVHFIAAARPKHRSVITAMRIYTNGRNAYTVRGARLNTLLPLAKGSYWVVVLAWDNHGTVYKHALPLFVKATTPVPPPPPSPSPSPSPIAMTFSSLPGGTVGAAYSATLTARGGTPPYVWNVVSGQLPAGLTLSSAGAISGKPTATGNFHFFLQVKDSERSPQAATQPFDIAVASGSTPTAHFNTLPPGSTLPTDADCASRVRRSSWEPRPDNATANHKTGITGNWPNVAPFSSRIDGNFTGTTDEILQWGACKWGFDEDIMRAQAVQESNWHQSQLGDYTSDSTLCSVIGQNAPCYQSYGILQIKGSIEPGTYPTSQNSTAFNVDFSRAYVRACYEGKFTWLGNGYQAGDLWGCIGVYFSGSWYDSGAQNYINLVKQHLANKVWLQPNF